MKKEDFKIGQTVFIKPSEHSRNKGIIDVEVIKVGRKYVTVKCGYRDIQFSIKSGIEHCDIGSEYKLYLHKKDIEDEKGAKKLGYEISTYFRYGTNLTLDKLIKIKEIIDND